MGKALSTSYGRSSTKSPRLSDFCFLRLLNSVLYNSCLLEGSKCSLRGCLIDECASVVLPVSCIRAMCAFSVSCTQIQSVFSSSLHLFRAAMLSKWLIYSAKFPVQSNFSGNTSGRIIDWHLTSAGELLFSGVVITILYSVCEKNTKTPVHTRGFYLSGYCWVPWYYSFLVKGYVTLSRPPG